MARLCAPLEGCVGAGRLLDSSSSSHAVVFELPRRLAVARRASILHRLAHGMHTWGATDREQHWLPGALPADGNESPTTVDTHNSLLTPRPQAASNSSTCGTGRSDFHSFRSVVGAKPEVLWDRVMRHREKGPLEVAKATGKELGSELIFSPQSPPKDSFSSPASTAFTTSAGTSPQKSSLKRAGFYNSSRRQKNVCWTGDEVLLFQKNRCVSLHVLSPCALPSHFPWCAIIDSTQADTRVHDLRLVEEIDGGPGRRRRRRRVI